MFESLAFRLMLARSFVRLCLRVGAGSGVGGFIVLVGVVLALVLACSYFESPVHSARVGLFARCCTRWHRLWGLFVLAIFVGIGGGTSADVRLFVIRPGNGVVVMVVRGRRWHRRAEKKLLYDGSKVLWHSPVMYSFHFCSWVSNFNEWNMLPRVS